MTRSMNEVMVLATKAARGAGAPPAQAAQFGAAAAAHLAAGRDVRSLHKALIALPDGPIIALPLEILRIAETILARGPLQSADIDLVQSYVSTLPYQAHLSREHLLELDLTKPATRIPVQRIELPDELYVEWSRLAARMLVPESDASRLSGAGAGLSDND
jgi:hypothetical protein